MDFVEERSIIYDEGVIGYDEAVATDEAECCDGLVHDTAEYNDGIIHDTAITLTVDFLLTSENDRYVATEEGKLVNI